jgi:O-antigen/teichoic acid export membrane protein
MLSFKNSIQVKSLFYVISNIICKGLSALILLILGFYLRPDIYGKFSLFYSFQLSMIAFSGIGIYELAVGRLSEYESIKKKKLLFSISSNSFFFTSILFFIFFFLYYSFSKSFNVDALFIIPSLISGFFLSFFLMQGSFYRILESYTNATFFAVFVSFFSLLFLFITLYFFENVEIAFLISSLILLSIFLGALYKKLMFVRRTNIFSINLDNPRKIFPYAIIAFFGWISGYGMNLIIYNYYSFEEISKYTFLLTISGTVQIIVTSINMVWSPYFYKLYIGNDMVLLNLWEKRIFYLIAFLITITSVFFYFLIPFLNNLFPNKEFLVYLKNSSELSLLFFGYLLTIPWWIAQNYFHINNAGHDLMKINLIFGIIAIVIWFICIFLFGTTGIYIGFALQAFTKSVGIYIYSKINWNLNQPVEVIFILSIIFLLMILL